MPNHGRVLLIKDDREDADVPDAVIGWVGVTRLEDIDGWIACGLRCLRPLIAQIKSGAITLADSQAIINAEDTERAMEKAQEELIKYLPERRRRG